MTWPEAARVAKSFPASKTGRDESQPVGSSRFCKRVSICAFSGLAALHASNFLFHAACAAAPRSLTARTCAKTSTGIANFSSGLRPNSFFVAAISSSPSADPCDFAVPRNFGAGHAITECIRINDGFVVSAFAANIAASSDAKSIFPSARAATS